MIFQQGSAARPEEELDRLTKKLVYDMNHPPTEEYFGMLHYFTFTVMRFAVFAFMTCKTGGSEIINLLFPFTLCSSFSSGRCARCGDNVLGDGSGCIAMEQVFHVECFTCITCHARLRGQPFYALEKKSYCESCYIVSLLFLSSGCVLTLSCRWHSYPLLFTILNGFVMLYIYRFPSPLPHYFQHGRILYIYINMQRCIFYIILKYEFIISGA